MYGLVPLTTKQMQLFAFGVPVPRCSMFATYVHSCATIANSVDVVQVNLPSGIVTTVATILYTCTKFSSYNVPVLNLDYTVHVPVH